MLCAQRLHDFKSNKAGHLAELKDLKEETLFSQLSLNNPIGLAV